MNAGVPEGVAEALSRGEIFFEKDAGHLFRKEMRKVVSGAVVRFETATWGFFCPGEEKGGLSGRGIA